jgi:hypothetical protein
MRRVFLAAAGLGAAVAVVVGVAGCNVLLDASDYAVGSGDGAVTGNPEQGDASSTSSDAGGSDAVADRAQGSPDGGVIAEGGRGDDGSEGDDGGEESDGSGAGAGLVGDPCFFDSDCASNQCFDSSWCTQGCTSATDTSCGLSTIGAQNYCEKSGADAGFECYTSCGTSEDCAELTGTVCESKGSQGICNITTGAIGDPCATGADSPYTACAAAADGGVAGTCDDYEWCSKSCTSNSQCGSNTTGQPNYCLQMGGVGGSVCVPSCTLANDCAPYDDTFCLPVGGSATEYACGTSGGQIGDPCMSDDDCIAGNCGDQYTCTMECAGADDGSCGISSQNTANACAYSNDAQEYECFAACTTDADCTPFPYDTAACTLLSGSYVCAYADSTQLRVKKQLRRHTRRRP